jgi:ribokinase
VTVVGSANYDTTVHVARAPRPGETVSAVSWATDVGGKGVNQAIACARAGASTRFVGVVGRDTAGAAVTRRLQRDDIDTSGIAQVAAPTGAAFITVTSEGENAIVLMAGANNNWDITDEQLEKCFGSTQLVVTQAEIPSRAQRQVVRIAHSLNIPVMLTAAPVANVAPDVLPFVHYLLVNEEEATQLAGATSFATAVAELSEAIHTGGWCIGTRGAREIVAATAGRAERGISPPKVQSPTDTTAAGDTFAGWCAAYLASGHPLEHAIREASIAAALSVTRPGAASSIPSRAALEDARSRLAF